MSAAFLDWIAFSPFRVLGALTAVLMTIVCVYPILAFARRGWSERSLLLRREGLRQASDGTFAEYYEPFTGEPLGSMQQSWTAAAVLDWLG